MTVPQTMRGPPELKVPSLAVGRSAALVLTPDHRLLRTGDFGRTWSAVDYAPGANLYGHASSVSLNHEGNGLLVHVPQRVFVTHDDGATWMPIASPSSGAGRCFRGGKDDVLVEGFDHKLAKLKDNVLVAEAPKNLVAPEPQPPVGEPNLRTLVLAGDHVVELQAQLGGDQDNHDDILVRTTRIGEKPGAFSVVPALASKKVFPGHSPWESGRVSGYASRLVYIRPDVNKDENRHTSTILRSEDAGLTWKADGTLDSDEPLINQRLLAVGPRGWTYIGALCHRHDEYEASQCTHAKVRPADAGAEAFEDLIFTEPFQPASFTFDERHDKVYALAELGRERKIYESSLTHDKFSRISMAVPTSWSTPVLSVDDQGMLRVFTFTELDAFGVQRRDAAGKDAPTLYLPREMQPDIHMLQTMVFAGPRGVLFSGDSYGWETADGGETWARVASNGSWEAQCSEAGCVSSEMQPIGWDLPRPPSDDVSWVNATSHLPPNPSDDEPVDVSSPLPPPPPLSLVCQRAGKDTLLPAVPQMETPLENGDGAWLVYDFSEGSVTSGGRGKTKRFTLLEPVPRARWRIRLLRFDGT